ncbi:MAG: hypothetical protein ACD_79C00962G0003 [uncultured bacterium]|nr:MAG: hypothetical protein ACD_79C00962G0003 [uncultured bacterium]
MKLNLIKKILMINIAVMITGLSFSQEGPVIALRQSVIIENNVVRLTELADVYGMDESTLNLMDSMVIGNTPDVGTRMFYSKSDILKCLRRSKVDTSKIRFTGFNKVEVMQPSTIITEADVMKKASQYIIENFGWDETKTFIKLRNTIAEIIVPKEETELQFSVINGTKLNGIVMLGLNVIQGNEIKKSLKLNFEVKVFEEVWVTNRVIEKDEIINAQDLILSSNNIAISKNMEAMVLSKDEIVGKIAVRKVDKGTVINSNYIARPLLIRKGAIVKLEVDTGILKVTSVGKALDKGFMGDIIRVKNLDSKITIAGKVISSDTVKVGE